MVFNKIKAYAGLYRLDVPVIVFSGAFAGRLLITDEFSWFFFFEAFFLALFPYNFVYTLNSITDKTEDSINKPWRPLPSKKLTTTEASTYLIFITVISVMGIPVIFNGWEIFLSYLVILLGFSYSVKPFAIKNRGLLSSIITGWGVVHPLYITGGQTLALTTTCVLFHGIGATLLKDLSDLKGDAAAGRKLITDKIPVSGIFLISLALMIFSAASFFLTEHSFISIIPLGSATVLTYNFFYKREFFCEKIYKKIIWTSALFGFFVILYAVVN